MPSSIQNCASASFSTNLPGFDALLMAAGVECITLNAQRFACWIMSAGIAVPLFDTTPIRAQVVAKRATDSLSTNVNKSREPLFEMGRDESLSWRALLHGMVHTRGRSAEWSVMTHSLLAIQDDVCEIHSNQSTATSSQRVHCLSMQWPSHSTTP